MSSRSSRGASREHYERVGELVSIFKRGSVWYANYEYAGKQHRKSLGTRSKKEARLRALRLDGELLQGELSGTPQPALVGDVIDAYYRYLEAERRKPKTRAKYNGVLERVREFAKDRRVRTINDIDITFVDAYRHSRVSAGRAPKTVYSETVILRQLVNFARTRGMVQRDPLNGLRIPEPKPTPQPCWSRQEVEQILTACRDADRPVLTVLADTGARIGELRWLTWDDVDIQQNVLHIRPKDDWTPKTGDCRAIPLSQRVRQLLEARPREHRWVFTAPASRQYPLGDHQISERRLLEQLKRVLARLELHGHLHTFRHAFISHTISTGTPEAVVRTIVGHVDERILRHYTHIADLRTQEAIRSLDTASDGPMSAVVVDPAGSTIQDPADSITKEVNHEDDDSNAA